MKAINRASQYIDYEIINQMLQKILYSCAILKQNQFIQWGKVHIKGTKEHSVLIKRLYESKAKQTGTINCKSDNLPYPEFEIKQNDIISLALVVGIITQM